ncbi:MAG: cytochrome c3 family protein [Desulfamplus sp.]|nr:cytochrome c3 family protein [Desulfamplus sp.]
MNRTILKIIIISLVIFIAAVVTASQKVISGAPEITLDGGSRGEVPFPHKLHQDGLDDCNVCHDTFPKELEVIKKMKGADELKKKQVMNEVCIKCHRELQKANKSTGPTSCKGCHS